MAEAQGETLETLNRAAAARRAGDIGKATRLLEELLVAQPDCAPALNSLGLVALSQSNPLRAADLLSRAAELDPAAPPVWLNLAEARRAGGDAAGEIAALDRALAIEPYLFPALFRKGQALERLGRLAESVPIYRAMLAIVADPMTLPESARQALAHARRVVEAAGKQRLKAVAGRLEETRGSFPGADLARAEIYAEQVAGRRKIYQQQPTGGHFPFLPAIEFFDRIHFPWFAELEAAAPAIRAELLSLWEERTSDFRPYVGFDATAPVNQWAELNHSSRWSAWFLWENGVRHEKHCARCPATAAVLDAAPMLDLPGKGPSAMFSVLDPRTRIPPHTGSSNVRTTVHLPLVVPEGCGFRVGGETRSWREGEASAFDDTIEHEAWNDSELPRAILILDVWNPLLSEAERAAVRAIG